MRRSNNNKTTASTTRATQPHTYHHPHDPSTPYTIPSLGPAGVPRLAPNIRSFVPGSITTGRSEFLPLNLIAHILTFLDDDPATLAAVCRTKRLLYYMALPLLWKNVTLNSSNIIRNRKKRTCDGEMKDVPEGIGGASPFAMGLNALVTRENVGALVKRLRVEGEYGEGEVEVRRCSRVGRASEGAMMVNICVRAAVDNCVKLEAFEWGLDVRLMPTVYKGLAALEGLRCLQLRMSGSRAAQPSCEVPPMKRLRRLVISDYDPLCYPDDVATLIYEAKELEDLQVHFSPRMREASEPSVHLNHLLRKNIATDRKLRLKRLGCYNFFGKPEAELTTKAANIATVEEFTSINSFGKDEDDSSDLGSTFIDQSWLENSEVLMPNLKVWRVDQLHRAHLRSLQTKKGLQKIYLVNARPDHPYGPAPETSCAVVTPSSSSTSTSSTTETATTASFSSKPKSPSLPIPSTLKELYLEAICKSSGPTLQHLIFNHKWIMSTAMVAKLIRACPNLTQLSACIDCSDMEFTQILLPFLRRLEAVRVTVSPSPRDCAIMTPAEREAFMMTEESTKLLRDMLSGDGWNSLRWIGIGELVWEASGWEEVSQPVLVSEETGETREEVVRKRCVRRVPLEAVKDVAIWKVDTLDVI